MATTHYSKQTIYLNMVFMLLFLLHFVIIADCRFLGEVEIDLPHCDSVFGVKTGDTCFEIAKAFKLTTPAFESLNPNLDCTKLFVGQWLCVQGIPK